MLNNFFHISERNSTVKTEVIGGITTFFAVAYIIFVNPNYLSATGMNFTAVMFATCISAAIGCFLTAFLGNVPFVQAPGMGLNAFFTYTICFAMGYTWQQALAIVFISGVLFLIITISPLRQKIIAAIPKFLKSAISVGIGLFITFIGLLNADIVKLSGDVIVDGAVVATDYSFLGSVTSGTALLAIIGIIITGILIAYKVKGAIFIGIIITAIIGIPMGITQYTPAESYSLSVLGETFMKMDFGGLFSHGVLPLITAVLSFTMVDMFDTVGTLLGTASNAGMLDKDGNFPGGDRALIADAIATVVGACLGTSTVTTYVESSTGIQAGSRTGLSAVVTGILFILACFLAPIASIIPSAATAPALIIVGVYMIKGVVGIEWNDFEIALPCFLTIAMMPFAYSIADGIGFGFISYVLIKLFRRKFNEISPIIVILAVLFALKYILMAIA